MTDLFQQKANEWDAREMIQKLSKAVGSAILNQVSLDDRMRVMDFGAGTGLISSQVAPLVQKIVAVDISESMLTNLAAKADLQDKVEIRCQDILQKPLADEFDLIMSAMALHHVQDTSKLVQRLSEHLKSGGQVALADLDLEDGSFHPADVQGVFHHGFDRAELQAEFEKQGFAEVEFINAHEIVKQDRSYSVFLLTAQKK